jgi:hypothetical protein
MPCNKLFKIVILVILWALAVIAKASPIQNTQTITEKMMVDVAWETFYAKSHHVRVNSAQFKKRALQVREFILSNGGDNWYKSYLEQFGAPTTPEKFNVATMIGVSEKKLGYYYLRLLPVSPDQMKSSSCNSSNFNLSPTMKGFCGLTNFNAAIAFNDSQSLADFQKWAKWFLENQKNGKYEWSFDLPAHNQKAPWVSGLTQSLAISVLLREYQLTNDEAYLKAASEALAWIKKPIQQGGCSIRKVNGTWYEEYPNIRKPSHVLRPYVGSLWDI